MREFIESVGCFVSIGQCTFDPAFAYLAYRRSEEVDWVSLLCFGCYPYFGQTGVVVDVTLRQICSKKKF